MAPLRSHAACSFLHSNLLEKFCSGARLLSARRFLSAALVVFALFVFARTTPAQTAFYATGASTTFGFAGQSYTNGIELKPRTSGFIAGVFYTLPSFTRIKAGLDGRYTFAPGYNGGKAYTAAIRISFIPEHFLLRPYGEFGGGVASTQLRQSLCNVSGCTQSTTQISSGLARFGAGLDIHVNRLFGIRAIDYQYDTAGRAGITHPAMQSISAGLVFHLPSRRAGYP